MRWLNYLLNSLFIVPLQTEINDIPTNNEYTLKIAGSTKSIFYQSSYIGEFSDEVEFALEGKLENCPLFNKAQPTTGQKKIKVSVNQNHSPSR